MANLVACTGLLQALSHLLPHFYLVIAAESFSFPLQVAAEPALQVDGQIHVKVLPTSATVAEQVSFQCV
jgi:hypothetical protein